MQGRNGVDQFARFTMGVALAAIVLTLFTGTRSGIGAFLDLFGMAAIVYTYFRIFSKNISKRYQENQKYLQMTDKSPFPEREANDEPAQGLSYLQLPWLRSENPYSQRRI